MDTIDLYALNMIPGLGKKSLLNIIRSGLSASDLMALDYETMGGYVKGAGKKAAHETLTGNFIDYQDKAENSINSMSEKGIAIITCLDTNYPYLYSKISDPPIFLYVRGNIKLLNMKKSIAVIGTRECSGYGQKIASSTSKHFANEGYNIVSGLAIGIDTAGHKGALSAHGKTTAILTDVEKIYPKENLDLADEILENNGLLIAENPPGTFPHRGLFVSRDRLQSALSVGVFPVETDIKGGTMHTVRFSEDQRRPIFCPDLLSIPNYPRDFTKARGVLDLINTKRAMAYTKDDYGDILDSLRKSEQTLWGTEVNNDNLLNNEQLSFKGII